MYVFCKQWILFLFSQQVAQGPTQSNCTGYGYTCEMGFEVTDVTYFMTCGKFTGLNWYHVFIMTNAAFSIGYKLSSLLQLSYWLVIFED